MNLLKRLALGVGILLGVALIAVGVLYVKGARGRSRVWDIPAAPVGPVPTDSARVARGKHLADAIAKCSGDGIKESVPFSPTMAVPITLETVGGNHVILELAPGVYAFYAHLQPGSIRVKLGDTVNRGDPVGLLGNSGNSTAPHLHFHLTDGNSLLGAEGIPFEFDRFELLGTSRASRASGSRPSPRSRRAGRSRSRMRW